CFPHLCISILTVSLYSLYSCRFFSSGSDTESIRKCVTCLVAFSVLFATLIYFNSHLAIRKCSPRALGLLWLGYRILQKMRHLFGRVLVLVCHFDLLQFSHCH